MSQFEMFKSSSHDGLAKRFDPVTSHEAGEDFVESGKNNIHYGMILDALGSDVLTNMQIAERSGLTQNQVTRRMTELERRNLVRRGDIIICPILKRRVGTWVKC